MQFLFSKKTIVGVVILIFLFAATFKMKGLIIFANQDVRPVLTTVKLSVCGDEVIENPEDCEGQNLYNQTCQSLGYQSGTLVCDAACTFDLSQCVPYPSPTPTAVPTPSATPIATPQVTQATSSNQGNSLGLEQTIPDLVEEPLLFLQTPEIQFTSLVSPQDESDNSNEETPLFSQLDFFEKVPIGRSSVVSNELRNGNFSGYAAATPTSRIAIVPMLVDMVVKSENLVLSRFLDVGTVIRQACIQAENDESSNLNTSQFCQVSVQIIDTVDVAFNQSIHYLSDLFSNFLQIE